MKVLLSALFCSVFVSHVASAQPSPSSLSHSSGPSSDQWRFSVTPYAWAIGITGSVSHNGSSLGQVKLTPGDVLSNLKMAAMLVAEARRGPYGIYLDGMYGNLGSSSSRVVGRADLSSSTNMTMTIATLAPTYNFISSPSLQLDGLVGARVLWQNARTSIYAPQIDRSFSESSNLQLAAGIAGVKGRYNFDNSKYFVPFYVDVGAGQSSSFTSQAYLGIGRAFDWGDVSLVAKNVYYQFKPNQNTIDLNLFGAAIAATFRF
ncbi:hypothetical protein [Zwartia vadi]|uniref:hypothetical protein n=1 Tax=Zwartia vadi TaxID=3058168 RepID=UPI0025B458D4|nr:hypothetical protein [Zwartia vadi]MDN3988085.1 hypothetical protein [Zwartia vadi]